MMNLRPIAYLILGFGLSFSTIAFSDDRYYYSPLNATCSSDVFAHWSVRTKAEAIHVAVEGQYFRPFNSQSPAPWKVKISISEKFTQGVFNDCFKILRKASQENLVLEFIKKGDGKSFRMNLVTEEYAKNQGYINPAELSEVSLNPVPFLKEFYELQKRLKEAEGKLSSIKACIESDGSKGASSNPPGNPPGGAPVDQDLSENPEAGAAR